jgi:hypothetical protein
MMIMSKLPLALQGPYRPRPDLRRRAAFRPAFYTALFAVGSVLAATAVAHLF